MREEGYLIDTPLAPTKTPMGEPRDGDGRPVLANLKLRRYFGGAKHVNYLG